eukprot:gene25692-11357_t
MATCALRALRVSGWSTCDKNCDQWEVRVRGLRKSESRSFSVDRTPPATFLNSSVPITVSFDGQPSSLRPNDNITFTFSATDNSPVTFQCMVSVVGYVPTHFMTDNRELTTYNKTLPCTSPVSVSGFYAGDWSFEVHGTDAGGNIEVTKPFKMWRVDYVVGHEYTRLINRPNHITNNSQFDFRLQSIIGDATGDPEVVSPQPSFDYKLWQGGTTEPASFTPAGSTLSLTQTEDGLYHFKARTASYDVSHQQPDDTAEADILLDTTLPVLQLGTVPKAITTAKDITISFDSIPGACDADVYYCRRLFKTIPIAGDAEVYYCRWLYAPGTPPPSDSPDPPLPPLLPKRWKVCSGGPNKTSSKETVVTGYWLFQVKAVDTASNMAAIVEARFRVDNEPRHTTSEHQQAACKASKVKVTLPSLYW